MGMTTLRRQAVRCKLCQDSGEVLVQCARTIGYTLTPGETIDEHLEPCPICKAPDSQEEAK